MRSTTKVFIALTALALSMLACGVTISIPEDAIEIGPTVDEAMVIPAPDTESTIDLTINFGSGKLILTGGANEGLIQGTAMYNVAEFKPEVTSNGNHVTLEQSSFNYDITGLPNFGDLENTWDLHLGSQPLDLEIRAGAFDGKLDLGGMKIESLRLFSGASNVNLDFSSPNLTEMSTFRYTTGASNIKLLNLSNANFSLLIFKAGIGDYTLDFGGELNRDATVELDAGLSNITLVIPEGIPAEVQVAGSLNKVNASENWIVDGSSYIQAGSGPGLTIRVEIGAGNLNLEN